MIDQDLAAQAAEQLAGRALLGLGDTLESEAGALLAPLVRALSAPLGPIAAASMLDEHGRPALLDAARTPFVGWLANLVGVDHAGDVARTRRHLMSRNIWTRGHVDEISTKLAIGIPYVQLLLSEATGELTLYVAADELDAALSQRLQAALERFAPVGLKLTVAAAGASQLRLDHYNSSTYTLPQVAAIRLPLSDGELAGIEIVCPDPVPEGQGGEPLYPVGAVALYDPSRRAIAWAPPSPWASGTVQAYFAAPVTIELPAVHTVAVIAPADHVLGALGTGPYSNVFDPHLLQLGSLHLDDGTSFTALQDAPLLFPDAPDTAGPRILHDLTPLGGPIPIVRPIWA